MGADRTPADVRWVGGGSGAGKTTIARRLAAEAGWACYDSDAAMARHAQQLDESSAPLLHRFLAQTMDERWLARPPAEMLDSFHWFAGEGFDLVIDDVTSPELGGGIVIAEGFRLLPRLVAPLLPDRRAAVWLLPSPEFRRMAFETRGSLWAIAGRTSDPPRALDRLLERDRLFTDRLRSEASDLGLFTVEVDLDDTEDDVYQAVADRLLAAAGPTR